MQEDEAFRPIEATLVSSGRTAYSQLESVAETNGFVGLAIDLRDELMSLGRFGISAGQLAVVLGDNKVRSIGRQLWEQRRSLL